MTVAQADGPSLTEQVQHLIWEASERAAQERRKYRIRAVRGSTGTWYYEALPQDRGWR